MKTALKKLKPSPPKKSAIKENWAVADVRQVIKKFVSAAVAFSSSRRMRVGKVVRTDRDRFLVLFGNGRWTVSGNVDGFRPYAEHESQRDQQVWVSGRHMVRTDIEPYLPALVEVGLLTTVQLGAFKKWLRDEIQEAHRAQRLAELYRDAGALDVHITVVPKSVVVPKVRRG